MVVYKNYLNKTKIISSILLSFKLYYIFVRIPFLFYSNFTFNHPKLWNISRHKLHCRLCEVEFISTEICWIFFFWIGNSPATTTKWVKLKFVNASCAANCFRGCCEKFLFSYESQRRTSNNSNSNWINNKQATTMWP